MRGVSVTRWKPHHAQSVVTAAIAVSAEDVAETAKRMRRVLQRPTRTAPSIVSVTQIFSRAQRAAATQHREAKVS